MQAIDKEYTDVVMGHLRKKYIKMNEISELTKQLEEAFKLNDPISIQMFMDMRVQVMDQVDIIDLEIQSFLEKMPEELGKRMNLFLKPQWEKEYAKEENEIQVGELCNKIRAVVGKMIEIDKRMNQKIGGKESFYGERK